jgi:predicted nuclease with TOPRIM domain
VTVAEQATTQLIKAGISSRYAVTVYIITQMMRRKKMEAWYDDIDSATLQRIKTYSAFNDATSKNLMVQTMYEYREKEIQDFKETNHELAETCIARKKRIAELEKENAELKERNKELLESCKGATMMYNDLCKAKEIIKSLMLFAEIDCREYEEAYKKAEQFLNNEVEK